jgi:hypothetical protein
MLRCMNAVEQAPALGREEGGWTLRGDPRLTDVGSVLVLSPPLLPHALVDPVYPKHSANVTMARSLLWTGSISGKSVPGIPAFGLGGLPPSGLVTQPLAARCF